MNKINIEGEWSVAEATALFKDKSSSDISHLLDSFESSTVETTEFLKGNLPENELSIRVEILPSGEMRMDICQSLKPRLEAFMYIGALMDWKITGHQLSTRTRLDSLDVKIRLKDTHDHINVVELEKNTLENLLNSPQWNKENTVSILFSGTKSFLTRSQEGICMLHYRNNEFNH